MKILENEYQICGGYFDFEVRSERIKVLENEILKDGFWNDQKLSSKIISELNEHKNLISSLTDIKTSVESNLEILKEMDNDLETASLLEGEIKVIEDKINELEIKLLLNNPYDAGDLILEIHAGAGGTESCDWASMLKRMYLRWCDSKKYSYEIIDEQEGLEAGIKSTTIIVRGINAYGYLKSEKGVHRLVRISPFDSGARRHTSFASVDIEPLFENDNIDIEIKDSDIRIDCYCASGHGGQGVNTTPSAVRITHYPTGIVVTCQNERSQIQNKAQAMDVLKSKLYKLELEKKESQMKEIKGEVKEINFGSQIRSYVMCPYTLVKDHRTNAENVNVQKVLDGDIDMFINEYLKN